MSDTTAVNQSAPAAPVVAAPKLNAIQLIEQEIAGFIKQRETAIANVHAIEGAIQAAQHFVGKLKAEAAKAEAEVGKVVTEVKKDAAEVIPAIEEVVESIGGKVLSIEDAKKQ